MRDTLRISTGQYSTAGRKPANQDSLGLSLPEPSVLRHKGAVLAIADGISSSQVSHIASATAVQAFIHDYLSTPPTWSVRRSAQRVLAATNAWLHAQASHSQSADQGYVCSFSALILKSTTAHLFHVGDARIYRLHDGQLEQLTEDHRLYTSHAHSYLTRALGASRHVEIDYRAVPLHNGDLFMLLTDGVYPFLGRQQLLRLLQQPDSDLESLARQLAEAALANGSDDNLSVQLVRLENLPTPQADEWIEQLRQLPLPPLLEPGQRLDGLRVVQRLHSGSRSHVYLVEDESNPQPLVAKVPSAELAADSMALARMINEEWLLRHLQHPHLQQPAATHGPRRYLYTLSAHAPGCTLREWMHRHPLPDLESVRRIVLQIARGLQALHRLDILHQDLRPENVLIDSQGHVRLIDLGAAQAAGLTELQVPGNRLPLGSAAYAAPEYFLGEAGSERSDQFSLGVLTYEMLCGHLPYGTQPATIRNRTEQQRLVYRSLQDEPQPRPAWLDQLLRQAVHPLPERRHEALSRFVHLLQHPQPSPAASTDNLSPQQRRLRFWKHLAMLQGAVLSALVLYLLTRFKP